jgi:hypothetical protein
VRRSVAAEQTQVHLSFFVDARKLDERQSMAAHHLILITPVHPLSHAAR